MLHAVFRQQERLWSHASAIRGKWLEPDWGSSGLMRQIILTFNTPPVISDPTFTLFYKGRNVRLCLTEPQAAAPSKPFQRKQSPGAVTQTDGGQERDALPLFLCPYCWVFTLNPRTFLPNCSWYISQSCCSASAFSHTWPHKLQSSELKSRFIGMLNASLSSTHRCYKQVHRSNKRWQA